MGKVFSIQYPVFSVPLAVSLLLLASGCGQKEPAADLPSPEVLAIVDGTAITEGTFRYWWEKQPMVDTPKARQALLDKLVHRAAFAQAAREAGLHDDPVVAQQIETLLISRLKELELQPKMSAIEVTDSDIAASYESRKETHYTLRERTRVAVLWFATRGVAPLVDRYKPKLEQAREKILAQPGETPADKGFGQLAIRNSEHAPSRYKGGIVGWIESGQNMDPWRAAVLKISSGLKEAGQVSEVTETKEGLFLVRLLERSPARVRELSEVRENIARELATALRETIEAEFDESVRENTQVNSFPERLQALAGLATRDTESARPSKRNLDHNQEQRGMK